jgi:hypothetical protein
VARKTDFTKRAEELLTARRASVQRLGELLDTKTEQEAALAQTNANIEKAVIECLDAGWKPTELTEIGVPKSAMPRRQSRTAKLEPRSPAGVQPAHAPDTSPEHST